MIEIKKAEPSDVPFLAEAETELFSDGWSEGMLSDCLEQKHYGMFVAWCQGQQAGYLITTHILDEGEVLRIGCRKAFQKRGVAAALLQHWLDGAADRGMTAALLEVRSQNRPAIALYEKFGFAEEGRRKGYYKEPLDDALLMGLRSL